MKKALSLLMALVLLCALALPARADIIWEPFYDSFYEENHDRFNHAGYYVYTNGPDGGTQQFDIPGGEQIGTLANGFALYVQHIYTDPLGKQWGLFDDVSEEHYYIPMDQLLDRYDDEFFDDHPEITGKAVPDGLSVKVPMEAPILLWTYPCGVPTEATNRWDTDLTLGTTSYYQDEEGLYWGYIGYWMGHVDAWVCLSDVYNPTLQEDEIYLGEPLWGGITIPGKKTDPADGESSALPDRTPDHEIVKKTTLKPLFIILPIAAAVLAVLLLLLLPRKKKD